VIANSGSKTTAASPAVRPSLGLDSAGVHGSF
jgi:hypothetical protein